MSLSGDWRHNDLYRFLSLVHKRNYEWHCHMYGWQLVVVEIGSLDLLPIHSTRNSKEYSATGYLRTSEFTAANTIFLALLQTPLSVSWQRILTQELQDESYRTGPMNLLIIPQVMHITAHNYDIIIRGPCWVEWCAHDPASGSPYAARSRTMPKRVCSAQATVMEYTVEQRVFLVPTWKRRTLSTPALITAHNPR